MGCLQVCWLIDVEIGLLEWINVMVGITADLVVGDLD